MKNRFQKFLFFLMISASVNAQGPAEKIPAFSFFKLDKSLFTERQLTEEKKIFFVFFDAACEHCQHAIQYMNQHHREFDKAAVYLITIDNPSTTAMFLNQYGKILLNKRNVTLLQDKNNEFIRKFNPRKYPSLFLYSSQRKLILYDDNEQNLSRFVQLINSPGR